jgi:putative hemolysin
MAIINVKHQIKNSNSKLLRKLPDSVIRMLEKIVHQDEMNEILNKYSNDIGVNFLPRILKEMDIKVEIEGINNLPECGKCCFVANHPFGIIDGLVLTSIVSEKYGDLKAIGNDLFVLIPQLRPLIAAVNVFGTNKRDYLLELDKVFNSDVPITHFPAGLVSRMHNMKVIDSKWQKSFIHKSIEYKREIVPLYFYGRNSNLFYFIYLFRKVLGIKSNLELALLPHEFFNKRGKVIRVKIGKPISYHSFKDGVNQLDAAQEIKSLVYEMGRS